LIDIWLYFAGFILMAMATGFMAWCIALSIRDLQRKIKSLTAIPPETVKYVVVVERYAGKVDGYVSPSQGGEPPTFPHFKTEEKQ